MPLTKEELKQIARDVFDENHGKKRYTRSELLQIGPFNMSFLNDENGDDDISSTMTIFIYSALYDFFLFKQLLTFNADDRNLLFFLILNLFKMKTHDSTKTISLILKLRSINVDQVFHNMLLKTGKGQGKIPITHKIINLLSIAIIKLKTPIVMEMIQSLGARKMVNHYAYDVICHGKTHYMNKYSIADWDEFLSDFEILEEVANKKERDSFRENMKTNARTEVSRTKAKVQRQKQRTNNKICTNSIDFILQEDIGDIPKEDLIYIKKGAQYYCFEKDSFAGMIKYSTPVRGACKPAVRGQPLDCEDFYPINLGFNVYISEENWIDIEERTDIKKWKLTNKRVVDFTTGLHMMSEKSGKDDVYDLVPANYQVGGKKLKLLREKKRRRRRKKVLKKKRSKKRIRRHQGINQRTGRLNKGYGYSKDKLKSGLRKIIKKKVNKK